MISDRLLQISLFLEYTDTVIDIGSDHALLDIYLINNKLVRKALATDISKKALAFGEANIKKAGLELVIPSVLSDGLKNINLVGYNTLVIAGMGAHTIINILSERKKLKDINKIVISSNNDYELVRTFLSNKGYFLEDEAIVYDKSHYYSVMKFVKSHKKNKKNTLKYGILKIANINYYEEIISKNKTIINKLKKFTYKRWLLNKENRYYHRYIKKIIGRKLELN